MLIKEQLTCWGDLRLLKRCTISPMQVPSPVFEITKQLQTENIGFESTKIITAATKVLKNKIE